MFCWKTSQEFCRTLAMFEVFSFLLVQITSIVSPSVRPYLSKGNHCYLISSRFVFYLYYPSSISIVMRSLLHCLNPEMHVCFVLSINDIFPQVSLNFAGGASMILIPQDYLVQQSSIVSSLSLILIITSNFLLLRMCLDTHNLHRSCCSVD